MSETNAGTEKPPVYWITGAGERVYIPRLPIERRGDAIPGPVTRPDGSIIHVLEDDA
jgi:hypothetical protein